MPPVQVTRPVPPDRASVYRAAGWWDSRGLGDGIERAAGSTPDELALADDRTTLSWTGLGAAVAGGVRILKAAEIGAGDPLVVMCGNTIAGAVVIHAALRRGAITALLDRRVGTADVEATRRALGGAVRVVAAAPERARLGLDPTAVVESELFGGAPDPLDAPWAEPDRDAPAVVLFTSGTTGNPKAVVHSLNTLTAGAANMATITGCDAGDVLFLVSPLASITGVMQLLLAADQHAALVLTDSFDPDPTLSRMDEVGATILGGAPVIAERLLEAAQLRGTEQIALRTLALGGAMLPRPMLELATERFGIEVARVYGSSEAPNFSGSTPDDAPARRLADDGKVTAGGEILVGSVEHPEEGLVRGPSVFLGYADPADNDHSFEHGWYRTGDLVEMHDGRLTVTGRLKEIVNRNGLKISPSEIDRVLTSMPGIVEHACFGVHDPSTGERLAVAVRPVEGRPVRLKDVTEHLLAAGVARRKLPEQLVEWVGSLPRTPSGKIIRSQLVRDAASMASELADRLHSPPAPERTSP